MNNDSLTGNKKQTNFRGGGKPEKLSHWEKAASKPGPTNYSLLARIRFMTCDFFQPFVLVVERTFVARSKFCCHFRVKSFLPFLCSWLRRRKGTRSFFLFRRHSYKTRLWELPRWWIACVLWNTNTHHVLSCHVVSPYDKSCRRLIRAIKMAKLFSLDNFAYE